MNGLVLFFVFFFNHWALPGVLQPAAGKTPLCMLYSLKIVGHYSPWLIAPHAGLFVDVSYDSAMHKSISITAEVVRGDDRTGDGVVSSLDAHGYVPGVHGLVTMLVE